MAFARLYPMLNKGLRATRLGPLIAKAVDVEEICPAETSYSHPVIMDPADWDRITRIQEETTAKASRDRVKGGERQHEATLRYTYRDVLATPRGFFTLGSSYNRFGNTPLSTLLRAPVEQRARGHYGLPKIAMKYFGHWLRDAVPATLLRRDGDALYFPPNPGWSHTSLYIRRLNLDPLPGALAHFDEMTFSPDIGQNSSRRDRMRAIHARLAATLPPKTADGVFICRGATGANRMVVNEQELAERFAARGFAVCQSSDDLETILAACSGARTVVTIEGSHWAHAFFAAGLGALHVTLNPADRFNMNYADYMPALDQRLATIVVDQAEGGYHIEPDRLEAFVDQARNAVAQD